ncbi:helix-turn-helix domain-containing protein [Nonomuraea jabiensis]|uniref:helix-turn-helix domain-containing protein n=1 Tax=Nonomuraea jabiensis TaxID=882448 RepID=UPI003D74B058
MAVEELEAFVYIAQSGGFTEAAKRLDRSQPAISRRIRKLERSLGCGAVRAGRSPGGADRGGTGDAAVRRGRTRRDARRRAGRT